MRYKRGRRFGLPHERQTDIYEACRSYRRLSTAERSKIYRLSREAGGLVWQAVFEAVTTERRVLDIAEDYGISESYLSKLIKRFYERF